MITKLFSIEELDSVSIPIDQFASYVSNMHQDNDFGFIRLFEVCSNSLIIFKENLFVEYL